jgi:hypothetical protein
MPKINFAGIDDAGDYTPLPKGRYFCRVDSIKESFTQHGDELWNVRYVVVDGPHKGRSVFDNLVFSEKAMKRVKYVCARLGVDVSGEIDLTPEMLVGKSCLVSVEIESYPDDEGKEKLRNRVPFAGIESADEEGDGGGDDEQPPF